ncbi:MAG: VCBS repeat-containing protein, partial [Phycisphaerae bacterium]|nr:VCBS repeat-containing protein [Phycisphaerae bacterium]
RRLVGHQEGGGNILSIGDIDQDGLLDVAVGSSELRLVQWFKNPGPAVLANGVRSPWYVFNIGELLNVTGVLEQIHLVDLNNDGTLDCFVSVHDASKGFGWIAGFQSQGDIYDTWEKFPIDSNEGRYGTVAFADFDSNGRLDFLAPLDLPGVMYDRIAFYSSIVDDRWRRNVIGCQENGADYMAVGDIDNDGQPDVAVGSAALGLVQWFRNPGTTSLIASQGQMPWKLSAIGAVGSDKMSNLQLVDLTGSGKLDCVATAGGAILAFWQGTNPQAEWQASLIEQLDNATIGRLAFAALNNNNGMLDFIAPIIRGNARDDRIAVYTLVARNQWQRRLIGQQPGNAGTISVGDIDGDGHPDIACSTGNLTQWFRNPGSQRLHNATIQVPWDVFNIGTVDADTVNQVRLVDLDSNGTLQCLVTGSGKAWGFKRGSNVTNYWQSFPLFITDPIAEVGTLGFGDFNKDGKLDFVVPISRNDSLDTLIKDHFFLFLRK